MRRLPVSIRILIVVWAFALIGVGYVVWWVLTNVQVVQNLQSSP